MEEMIKERKKVQKERKCMSNKTLIGSFYCQIVHVIWLQYVNDSLKIRPSLCLCSTVLTHDPLDPEDVDPVT